MSAQDPLLLLRQALVAGHEIQLLNDQGDQVFDLPSASSLSFTSPSSGTKRSFPKDTRTRFLRPDANPDDADPDTYDLAQLLHSFLTKTASVPEYLKQAGEAGVTFLPVTDRRVVNEWLGGQTAVDGLPRRIRAVEGGSSKREAEDVAPSAGGEGGAAAGGAGRSGQPPPAKKQRFVPNKEDQEKVVRLLAVAEGPQYGYLTAPNEDKKERSGAAYHNRETVLRGERVNVCFLHFLPLPFPYSPPFTCRTSTPSAPSLVPVSRFSVKTKAKLARNKHHHHPSLAGNLRRRNSSTRSLSSPLPRRR
jgi:parafibromin